MKTQVRLYLCIGHLRLGEWILSNILFPEMVFLLEVLWRRWQRRRRLAGTVRTVHVPTHVFKSIHIVVRGTRRRAALWRFPRSKLGVFGLDVDIYGRFSLSIAVVCSVYVVFNISRTWSRRQRRGRGRIGGGQWRPGTRVLTSVFFLLVHKCALFGTRGGFCGGGKTVGKRPRST